MIAETHCFRADHLAVHTVWCCPTYIQPVLHSLWQNFFLVLFIFFRSKEFSSVVIPNNSEKKQQQSFRNYANVAQVCLQLTARTLQFCCSIHWNEKSQLLGLYRFRRPEPLWMTHFTRKCCYCMPANNQARFDLNCYFRSHLGDKPSIFQVLIYRSRSSTIQL